jgi:hypothetical protein
MADNLKDQFGALVELPAAALKAAKAKADADYEAYDVAKKEKAIANKKDPMYGKKKNQYGK